MLTMVYREVRGLHQAAYILALFAFGSQLLALVRDRMLANQFGAGAELDIYYAAFRVPDVLYVLFASTLSVYVLIPFVAKYKEADDASHARLLLSNIFSLFLIVYSVLAGLAMIFAPWLATVLFPGIADQTLLVTVMRILLLQPLLLGLSSLFGVITQLGHRFVLYAISPLIYNVGIILGIVVLYPIIGLAGLAWGVVLGAFGHMFIQVPLVRGSNMWFGFTTKLQRDLLWPVLAVSIPRAITLSLGQIVLLVLVGLASAMAVGSVSVFQFAFNLQSVPLAIIGVSYSVAAFPMLAELYAGNHTEKFLRHIRTALRHIIFWSVPVIVLCVVLRAQLVRVILGSGQFDWEDTRLTAAIFAVLIISLAAHAINLLMIRAFYAGGNTRTPLVITLLTSFGAVGLAVWLSELYTRHEVIHDWVVSTLRVADVAGTEVLVLALSYTVAAIAQSLLLAYMAYRKFGLKYEWIPRQLLQASVASLFGGVAAYAALNFLVEGLNTDTFIGIFLQGGLAGLFGLVGVVLGYALVGSRELVEVGSSLERKIFKTEVLAPQDDVL